jgi:hypothetical protein
MTRKEKLCEPCNRYGCAGDQCYCECHKVKNPAAQALRAIPSKKRSKQSRINGKKGGRPKLSTNP